MLGVTLDVLGLDIVITRPAPDDIPIPTKGIWLQPLDESAPFGNSMARRSGGKVMFIGKTDEIQGLDQGTVIESAELEGGPVLTWVVAGYVDAVARDSIRVVLVQTAD